MPASTAIDRRGGTGAQDGMIAALPLVIAQLGDPRIRRVLIRSLAIALLLFAGLWWGIDRATTGLEVCGWFGRSCRIDGTGSTLVAMVATIGALWLLFPPVAIGITNLFADEIVDAVEARHYPAAAAPRPLGWGRTARLSLASAARLILWNLLALPFYVLLIFTAVGPFLLFLAVNALALGRDLGDMVAVRHLDDESRRAWLARTRGQRALLGLAVTGAFLIPVANLLAPVVGAALATHFFHRSRRR